MSNETIHDSTHEEIQRAADALKASQMVIFPTDTVYGCGVSVAHPGSIERIYEAKQRDHAKPIAWLVSSPEEALNYTPEQNPAFKALMERFWPGALTIIVRANDQVPAACKSSQGTIGLRMPDNTLALALIRAAGAPLATSSANISGEHSVSQAESLDERLVKKAACVLSDGSEPSGVSSTVIDISKGIEALSIVREGQVSRAQIDEVLISLGERPSGGDVATSSEELPLRVNTSTLSGEHAKTTAHTDTLVYIDTTIPSTLSDICPDEPPAKLMVRLRFDTATVKQPATLVQILHGMSEHSERYELFARELVRAGYIVCMHDHIGHGYSVETLDELGDMPSCGDEVMLKDIEVVRAFADKTLCARGIDPHQHILMGHSMGSFLARVFLEEHAHDYDGIIICGTGDPAPSQSKLGGLLCGLLERIHSHAYRSTFVHTLGAGGFARGVKHAKTPLDWLCSDPRVIVSYATDERSGAMFSVGAYASLSQLTLKAHEALTSGQADLAHYPMLVISGKEDVVGDFSKAVVRVVRAYRARGADVMCILYEGMRHEILNEHEKYQVIRDIITWLDGVRTNNASL